MGDADDGHQQGRDTGGHEQCRPYLHRLAIIGAGEQPRAETGDGPRRQFADDGADQRNRNGDLQRGEEIGSAAGQRSFQKICAGEA